LTLVWELAVVSEFVALEPPVPSESAVAFELAEGSESAVVFELAAFELEDERCPPKYAGPATQTTTKQ
jgi:hypothetical protein